MTQQQTIFDSKRAVRVLVTDDSVVLRKLFTDMLNDDPDIEVVARARDGQKLVDLLADVNQPLDVDVVTLDIEMPKKDGMTALPEILALRPELRVIMVSTLTQKGGDAVFEAMRKGATDCIGKPSSDGSGSEERIALFRRELTDKVRAIGRGSSSYIKRVAALPLPVVKNSLLKTAPSLGEKAQPAVVAGMPQAADVQLAKTPVVSSLKALAIASSTGGPNALSTIFGALNGQKFRVPIFLTQHMPAKFTTTLAEQLQRVSGIVCKEGEDGETPKAGVVYVAPGDYHMTVKLENGAPVIRLNQEAPENFCRPSAEPMLRSLVEIYGNQMLLLVLTGMGNDGEQGAKLLSDKGGLVWVQDQETSVVWGMPGAVAQAGLAQKILPLERVSNEVVTILREKAAWQ